MTKAELRKFLNKSQARYKVLLKQQNEKIRDLQREIRVMKSDVAQFGKLVKRYPRTAGGETGE